MLSYIYIIIYIVWCVLFSLVVSDKYWASQIPGVHQAGWFIALGKVIGKKCKCSVLKAKFKLKSAIQLVKLATFTVPGRPAEKADAEADVQSHIQLLLHTDFLRGGVSPQGYAPYITDGHVD